ncbi:MAG: hypothetical protein ABF377_12580 [Akkermansiaceae bacterium]
MERHEWHINHSEEDHEYWRANHHAGRWTIMTKSHSDDHWETIKEPTTEHWEALREVLWKKYQRKRGNYKLIKKLDQKLDRTPDGQDL